MISAARRFLNRTGFDVVRIPRPYTLEKHLSLLLSELGVDCVIDVGAMHGHYAAMLRLIGYSGPIVSVDPVPSNIEILRRRSASDPLWTVVEMALGDAEGKAVLHVSRNSDLSSLLPLNDYGRTTFPGLTDEVAEITVPVRRLDRIDAEHLPPDARRIFLKTDTQGYDVPVFRGAAGLYPRMAAVQMELPLKPLYDGMVDVTDGLRALREAGFDVTGLFPGSSDTSGALAEVDCVARRSSGR